jgi:mono/diheme cytochrome c family protein
MRMLVLTTGIAMLWLAISPPCAQDSSPPPTDPLKLPGYKAFVRHCAPCHGERGDGNGVAARFLEPTPRDFKNEPFRFVSTANGAPSSKDIFEVIATGIGGTAMIPFASLGEEDLWPIVEVVDAFRLQGIRMRLEAGGFDAATIAAEIARRKPVLAADEAPEPPDSYESAARGLVRYRALCASCHGADGRGVMPESVPGESRPLASRAVDAAAVKPVRPRDLARGVLKQIATSRNLFDRIRHGMPGTAMPATDAKTLDAAGAWDLVHYLRTMIPEGAQPIASPSVRTIIASRLEGEAPASPDDPRFEQADRAWIAFAPFHD